MYTFPNPFAAVLQGSQPVGGSADQTKEEAAHAADIRRVNVAMLSALGVSALVLVMIGLRTSATGAVLMWGIASVAAGAAIGFLFGIPRVGRTEPGGKPNPAAAAPQAPAGPKTPPPADTARADPALRPNTNLEEVSDWLTKIIVGLGLVHLQDLQGIVGGIAQNAAAAISSTPSATAVSIATALIVGLAIEGFFGGYIYTRLFLQGAFARSDSQLSTRSTIESVLARTPVDEPSVGGQAAIPSSEQMKAAAEIERMAARDPRPAIEKMEELAREYEQVRGSMASGDERTRRMTAVVGQMTVIGLGAESQLARFAASGRPGDRLAAVVILKLRFNGTYSKWLADRLVEDPPFIGFQAASALLAGSRLLGGTQLEGLKVAVADAFKLLKEKGWDNDPSRDRLIHQILGTQITEPPTDDRQP